MWPGGVRALALLLLLAACEGVVLGACGPVAGAVVELFALAPAACPCPDAEFKLWTSVEVAAGTTDVTVETTP